MAEKKRTFKTKKALSGFRTEYRAWKEWDEDDTLIFKYIGKTKNRKAKNKYDWIVEVIEVMFADKKEAKRLKPGTKVTLNTAGMFDKGMEQLESGDIAQVVYNGSKEMEGGDYAGGMAHTMEVTQMQEEGDEDEIEDDEEQEEEDEDEDESDDEDEDDDL